MPEFVRVAGTDDVKPGSGMVAEVNGKGVQGLRNIALLKWARHYGLTVMWNLLYGFPGEQPSAYDNMAALMPRLWQ